MAERRGSKGLLLEAAAPQMNAMRMLLRRPDWVGERLLQRCPPRQPSHLESIWRWEQAGGKTACVRHWPESQQHPGLAALLPVHCKRWRTWQPPHSIPWRPWQFKVV